MMRFPMTAMTRVPMRILAPMLLLAACDRPEAADAERSPGVVAATVAVATVERFVEAVDAVGSVTPRPGHAATLAAPGPTRVAKVLAVVGAAVTIGDALIEFERPAFDAALRSAESALAQAEKAAERATRLSDAGVLPRKDAEAAATDLATARLNAVTARRNAELATLRSPINGVVTRMSAVLGASVDASQPLVDVADPRTVDAMLTLPPGDAARVRPGAKVTLYAGAAASGTPVALGTVADIAGAVDTASRGVAVRVTIHDAQRLLRIGETVFGRVGVAEHANAVTVPVEALVPTGEGYRVFVVDAQGVAHAQAVTVGGRTDTVAWIRDGVNGGDKVVTKGAYGVDDSTTVVTGGARDGDAKAAPVEVPAAPAPGARGAPTAAPPGKP
jgi:RND family efflux transporter MFP subunit